MRILLISYDFYPNIGGVTQHVFNLAKFLVKHGNEVYVLTLRYSFKHKSFETIEGIKVIRLFTFNISKIRGLFFLFFGSLFCFIFSLIKKIDVVHTHTVIPDSLVGLFVFSRKFVFTNHSSQFLELYDKKNKVFLKFLYKFIIKRYNVILAPSEELKEKSQKFFNKDKVIFISNGVDADKFSPINWEQKQIKKKEIFKKWNVVDREYVIFCPRRLEPKNGVEYFVDAIKNLVKLRNDFLAIISGNEYVKWYAQMIKNKIKENNLSEYILFTGSLSNDEIVDYYRISDIVVLPSLMEATSISGLEALSCGIPVIGTNIGGIPYIIHNGINGILVSPRNVQEITSAINYLLSSEKIRQEMGNRSRSLIEEKFSWDVIVKEVENIYQKF